MKNSQNQFSHLNRHYSFHYSVTNIPKFIINFKLKLKILNYKGETIMY